MARGAKLIVELQHLLLPILGQAQLEPQVHRGLHSQCLLAVIREVCRVATQTEVNPTAYAVVIDSWGAVKLEIVDTLMPALRSASTISMNGVRYVGSPPCKRTDRVFQRGRSLTMFEQISIGLTVGTLLRFSALQYEHRKLQDLVTPHVMWKCPSTNSPSVMAMSIARPLCV